MAFLGQKNSGSRPPPPPPEKYHTPSHCPKCGHDLSKPVTDDIQDKFDELEKASLSAWEENFITSLQDQYEKKKFLSPKQIEVLNKIYGEKCI